MISVHSSRLRHPEHNLKCRLALVAIASELLGLSTGFAAQAQSTSSSQSVSTSQSASVSPTSSSAKNDWRFFYDQGEQELLRQRPAEAEVLFKKALNQAISVSPSSDDSNKCRLKLADTLTLRNKTGEAIQMYQQLLAVLVKKYGNNSKQVVPVLFSLGSIQEALGDHTSAITYYQRALHINEKSYGDYSPAFAENLQVLGRANAKAGKKREAAKNYQQAMSILMNEPNLGASGKLESVMHDYSDLMQKDDDSDQSLIKDFKQDILNQSPTQPAVPGTSGNGKSQPLHPDTTGDDKSPLLNSAPATGGDDLLAKLASAQGFGTPNLHSLSQAESSPADQPQQGTAGAGVSSAWQTQTSFQLHALRQEQTNADSKIQLRGLQQPWSDQSLSPAYRVMQNSIVDGNRYGHGEDYYQRMIAIDLDSLGSHHPSVANDLTGLAQFYIGKSEYHKAEPLLNRAYEIYLQTYGMDNLLTIDTVASLARVQSNLGNIDKAVELYRTALTHCQSTFGSGHLETARILNELAYLYFHQGKLQESRKLYDWALASTEASVGKSSPWLAACLKDYAQVLRSLGQNSEALSLESRADSILYNHPAL